jgi:hypothetical protein
MTRYVQAGTTIQLTGTLAHGQELVALYGASLTPGALLVVNDAATNAGTVFVDGAYGGGSGATLANYGTLTNAGLLRVSGAAGAASAQGSGMLLNNGFLLNTGTIDLGGQPFSKYYYFYDRSSEVPGVLQNNGYLHNTGLVEVQGYEAQYYNFYGTSPGELNVAGVLVNDGTLQEDFGTLGYGVLGATVTVSGTLTNNADGLITGANELSAGPVLTITASGTLANAGTLDATFSNSTGMQIEVAGLLANSGTVKLEGGGGSYYGRTGGGELDLTGVMTNSGRVLVNDRSNTGSYNFGGSGATLNDSGVLSNTGSLVVYGGTVSSYDVQQPGGLLLDSAMLTNEARGVITLTGGATGYAGAGGATFDVSGVLDNYGLTQIGAGGAEGAVLNDTGLVRNHGTIALQGNSLVAAGVLTDSGRLINNGLITIAAGSGAEANQGLTVTAGGTLNNAGTIAGSGTLVNDGIIGSGGRGQTGGLISVATLVNEGTVTVAPHSAFDISSNVPFVTGQFDIDAGATLTLMGTIAFGQTVAFEGNNGTLAIGHALAFFADLDLAQPHETLDFLNRDVISAIASGTRLEIGFAGGLAEQYVLTAPLAADTTISLQQDASGGTDVVFSTPAAQGEKFPGLQPDWFGHIA